MKYVASYGKSDTAKSAKNMTKIFIWAMILCATLAANCDAQGIRLKDNSDWWSLIREDPHAPEIKPGNAPVDEKNFEILGIPLGENQFQLAVTKLGKATQVDRGDASTGRHQICYVSAKNPHKVYLILEFGEVEEVFYLFANGTAWAGEDLCTKSELVSDKVATSSGLRLGLTRSQLEAILGPPDYADVSRVFYSRQIRRKTSTAEFERMRKEYPERLTNKKAHEMFDYFDASYYVEAHFQNSKLNYLAVSRADTN